MKITKSELKEMIREALREELAANKQLKEAKGTSMYIVAADGEAGGSIYHMGTSKANARKAYQAVAKDWRELGLGGGDTPVCLYEYSGPTDVFDRVRTDWEAGEDTSYNINIEELGISLDNCDVLASEWGDI